MSTRDISARQPIYKLLFLKADGQNRTGDLTITNRLLYQLSYIGLKQNISKSGQTVNMFNTIQIGLTLAFPYSKQHPDSELDIVRFYQEKVKNKYQIS